MTDLQCPKCSGSMRRVSTVDGSAWRCDSCAGLWIDVAGHESLKAIARAVDIGDAEAGAKADAHDRIACPVCNAALLRMVDPQQAHIRFESCMNCHGRFYDAGEFIDYAEHDFKDFLRDLRVTRRD